MQCIEIPFIHIVVLCNDPGFIANGRRNRNGPFPFECGLTVQFSCRAGFSLIGASDISCETSGQWDGSVPRCAFLGNQSRFSHLGNSAISVKGKGLTNAKIYLERKCSSKVKV